MQRYQLTRRNQPATSTIPVYHASGLFAIVLPPSPYSIFVSPRRSLFLNLRLRNRTIPSLPHFCLRYISFHGSSFINLSFSPRIFHSPPSPADTCHSLSLLSPALSRLYRSFLSLWLAP